MPMPQTRPVKRFDIVPFITVPVGWMPCVACRDFRRRPGQMWLGYSNGVDLFITCPACKGKGEVPRVKHYDARTMQEIDYERPGQRFVEVSADTKIVLVGSY